MAGSTTALASVADKIHAILEAAEATAAAIRHEAEADAERAAHERRRRDEAREELSHLSRLADALSVQAEAVSRQCDTVARVLLPPEHDAGVPAEPTDRGSLAAQGPPVGRADPAPGHGRAATPEPAGPAASGEDSSADPPERGGAAGQPSASAPPSATATAASPPPPPDTAAQPETAGPSATAQPNSAADASQPSANHGTAAGGERLPSAWIEAYRMRLAGAGPAEVEAHLRNVGAGDPSKVVAEVFRDERPDS